MITTAKTELDLNKIQKYKMYLLNLSLDRLKKLIDKYSKPQREGYSDKIRKLKLNVIEKLNGEQIEALVQIAKVRFDILIQIDRDLVLEIINKIKELEISKANSPAWVLGLENKDRK